MINRFISNTKIALLTIFTLIATTCGVFATEIHISKTSKLATIQPLLYKTVELLPKFAAKHGIKDLKVVLDEVTNASTANDSLLLGRLDIVIGGINGYSPILEKDPSKLVLLSGWETFDFWLVCADPNIKKITDIGPNDKIMVKSLNAGEQLMLRQYLAAEVGANQTEKLNNNLVILTREEAFQLMTADTPKLACAFLGSPLQNTIVAMKKAHIVSKPDNVKSFGFANISYTTAKWAKENPELARAWIEAQSEAIKEYTKDPVSAIKVYLNNDKVEDITPEDVLKMKKENNDTYDTSLKAALSTLRLMYTSGTLKVDPDKMPDSQKVFDTKLVKIN